MLVFDLNKVQFNLNIIFSQFTSFVKINDCKYTSTVAFLKQAEKYREANQNDSSDEI